MDILVDARYLAHEGGTKFYEAIEFYNVAAKRFVLVKRWGKIALKDGGGQMKIETFGDIRQCQDAARKILSEKESKRDGAGHTYNIDRASFGLHGATSDKIDGDLLRLSLGEHYGDIDDIDRIMSGLEINDGITGTTFDVAIEDDVVKEQHAPEPERSGDWGSW